MFCHGNIAHQNLGCMDPEPCSMSTSYSLFMLTVVLVQPVWRPVAQPDNQDERICFKGHCVRFVGLWPWQTGFSHVTVTLSLIGRWMVTWCPMRAFPGCTIYLEKHVHLKEVWVLFEGVHCWYILKLIGNCCISAPWMEIHPESCIVHFITHFSCNNYFVFFKWISLLVLDTESLLPDIKPVCRAICVASRCDPNKYGMNCFVTGDDFMPASCFAYWNYICHSSSIYSNIW